MRDSQLLMEQQTFNLPKVPVWGGDPSLANGVSRRRSEHMGSRGPAGNQFPWWETGGAGKIGWGV